MGFVGRPCFCKAIELHLIWILNGVDSARMSGRLNSDILHDASVIGPALLAVEGASPLARESGALAE